MSSGSCLAIGTLAGCVPFLYCYNLVLRKETPALKKLTVQKVNQSGEFRERAEVGRFTSLGSFRQFFLKSTDQSFAKQWTREGLLSSKL